MTETAASTQITQVGTVAIPVTDPDQALAFYRDKLGFEVRRDAVFPPGSRWIEVAPPGSATTIALELANEGHPSGVDTGIRLYTRSADADHAELRDRGVDADEEVLRFGGGVPPMFTFRDPDGNRLVVVEGQ